MAEEELFPCCDGDGFLNRIQKNLVNGRRPAYYKFQDKIISERGI